MKTVDLPPYAPTLMESTRAIGYSIEAAIADIIDNSIAASASRVDIDFFPIGESYIAILDNGWGMTSESLIAAMQYGSRNPLETRDENDLGRYGLGMKTASLSQCRILTVLSKKAGVLTGAQWNLNHIQRAESWSLLLIDAEEAKEYPSFDKLNQYENGTLVIWQDLDKFAVGETDIAEAFTRKMELIREHLSLVFHRYLSGEPGLKKLDKLPAEKIIKAIEPAIMIQRMLSKAQEIFRNNIIVDSYSQEDGLSAHIRSFAVFDYLTGILTAPENDYVINSDVLCAADYGAPQKRMRFVVIGIKRSIATKIALPKGRFDEDEYRTVRDAIADLETVSPVYDLEDDKEGIKIDAIDGLTELAASLRNSGVLKNHIITKTTETAMERFKAIKQGQNFHSLDDELKTNTYTDVSRTQNTIYLRLDYDEPSGTVVNVRKSMWIHPTLDRAISVREAARLQTFPDSFVFCGTKDKQYQQVGNAVPPIMAKSIAKKLAQTLTKSLVQEKENG